MSKATKKVLLIGLAVAGAIVLAAAAFAIYNINKPVESVDQASAPSLKEIEQDSQDPSDSTSAAAGRSGNFIDGDDIHSGSGGVSIVKTSQGDVLKFDSDFSVTNGPDLFVYLSETDDIESSKEVGEFVSLGKLQSTSGEQIYKLPDNIENYKSVAIWCRSFVTAFAFADLD